MSACSVKTRRGPSRHCRDAKVYGHTTTAMHDMSTSTSPPPTCPLDFFRRAASWLDLTASQELDGGVSQLTDLFTLSTKNHTLFEQKKRAQFRYEHTRTPEVTACDTSGKLLTTVVSDVYLVSQFTAATGKATTMPEYTPPSSNI